METALKTFIGTRNLLKRVTEGQDISVVDVVPDGWNNSLHWNVAHILVTQQLLTYNLSGLPMPLSEELVAWCRKGTTPTEPAQSFADTVAMIIPTTERFIADVEAGIFENFNEYQTSAGLTLSSLADAVSFNNVHEGMHIGYCLALKRALV